jgi:hypothetical protein
MAGWCHRLQPRRHDDCGLATLKLSVINEDHANELFDSCLSHPVLFLRTSVSTLDSSFLSSGLRCNRLAQVLLQVGLLHC